MFVTFTFQRRKKTGRKLPTQDQEEHPDGPDPYTFSVTSFYKL